MSLLLEEQTEDYRFKFQLPLDWEKQLELVEKVGLYINSISTLWSIIRNDIMIYDMKDGEKSIWIKGKLQNRDYEKKMLKISMEAVKFFSNKFAVFMKEAGISGE